MGVGTDLEKINQLHKEGVLSEIEFDDAKNKLLQSLQSKKTVASGVHLMGKAAHSYVNFKIISALIGTIISVIVFFTFFLPRLQKMEAEHDKFSQQIDADIRKGREEMDKMSKDFDKNFTETKTRIDQTREEIEDAHRKSGIK